jgi:uncharacterized protein (UPF0332 family)
MATCAADLMAKARRPLKSARLVFSDGDPDSACNRAYYAMFNAARAALLAEGRTKEAVGKTHAGLIAAFALHLVKPGKIEIDSATRLGRYASPPYQGGLFRRKRVGRRRSGRDREG